MKLLGYGESFLVELLCRAIRGNILKHLSDTAQQVGYLGKVALLFFLPFEVAQYSLFEVRYVIYLGTMLS